MSIDLSDGVPVRRAKSGDAGELDAEWSKRELKDDLSEQLAGQKRYALSTFGLGLIAGIALNILGFVLRETFYGTVSPEIQWKFWAMANSRHWNEWNFWAFIAVVWAVVLPLVIALALRESKDEVANAPIVMLENAGALSCFFGSALIWATMPFVFGWRISDVFSMFVGVGSAVLLAWLSASFLPSREMKLSELVRFERRQKVLRETRCKIISALGRRRLIQIECPPSDAQSSAKRRGQLKTLISESQIALGRSRFWTPRIGWVFLMGLFFAAFAFFAVDRWVELIPVVVAMIFAYVLVVKLIVDYRALGGSLSITVIVPPLAIAIVLWVFSVLVIAQILLDAMYGPTENVGKFLTVGFLIVMLLAYFGRVLYLVCSVASERLPECYELRALAKNIVETEWVCNGLINLKGELDA